MRLSKLGNKGFTIMETVMALTVGMGLFFSVLFVPVIITDYNKLIQEELKVHFASSNTLTSVSNDVFESLGVASVDSIIGNKYVNMGNGITYVVGNDGIKRINGTVTTTLTKLASDAVIETDAVSGRSLLKFTLTPDVGGEDVILYFNLSYDLIGGGA